MEFIYRGQIRAEKDANLEEAEYFVEEARTDLKNQIQDLLNEMLQHERESLSPSRESPKTLTFASRFYEWLNGAERDLRVQRALLKAHACKSDVITLPHRIARIVKSQVELANKVAHFLDVAQNVRDHQIETTSGWTWWR